MSTSIPRVDDSSSAVGKVGDQAVTGILIPVYLVVEGTKAAGRGIKALTGEMFSVIGSAFREVGHGLIRLPVAVGHSVQIPLEYTAVGLTETGTVGVSSVIEGVHGVQAVAKGTFEAVALPLRPMGLMIREGGSYIGPAAGEVVKGAGQSAWGGLQAGYGATEGLWLEIAELVTYIPPGLYQIEDLCRACVSALLTIIGNGSIRAVLTEGVTVSAAAGSEAQKGVLSGAEELGILTQMLAGDVRTALVEVGSVGGSAGSELKNGLVQIPSHLGHALEPFAALVRESTREVLSTGQAAGHELIRGEGAAPLALDHATEEPRILLKAAVVEFLTTFFSGGRQALQGIGYLGRGSWRGTEMPREKLAAVAKEVGSTMLSGGSEGMQGIRTGFVGAYHFFEVTGKDLGVAILQETISTLKSSTGEALKTGYYLKEDVPETYDVIVKLPMDLWYLENEERIRAAYNRATQSVQQRWQGIRDWFQKGGADTVEAARVEGLP